ncbi:MAG: hypothetical protein FJY85_09555 [Deltaproteobacteria bacterium]|nr:hypothetical protein [Deltaproteobacteria bacterium]
MKERIQNTIWFLVENGPAILTVIFAAYVILLSQRGSVSQSEVLVWILTILGLLATSELVERFRRLRNIQDTSVQTLDIVRQLRKGAFLKLHGEGSRFAERAKQARQIFLGGYTLINVVGSNMGLLEQRLKDGCQLRVLMIDPNALAGELIRSTELTGRFSRDAETVLAYMIQLRETIRSTKKGKLEVRLLNFVPSCGFIIIDGGQPYGWMSIGIYPPAYKSRLEERVHFELNRDGDQPWFGLFMGQYEKLWGEGRPWEGLEQ